MNVSIALCTYNGEKYLREQLDSIAAQTLLPKELVVCDDCSTDTTVDIIRQFAAAAKFPVRLHVNNVNLKSTKNFEQAILRCGGDITFLCDQDDVWHSDKIKRIVDVFTNKPEVGLVFSNAELVDENLRSLEKQLWDITFSRDQQYRAKNGEFVEVLIGRAVVTGATAAFRTVWRDIFVPVPIDTAKLIHDEWIAFVIATRAAIEFIDEPLMKYRQHPNQQIGVLSAINRGAATAASNFQEYHQTLIVEHETHKHKLSGLLRHFEGLRARQPQDKEILRLLREEVRYFETGIEHLKFRLDLPTSRLARARSLWEQFAAGHYHRYSNGFASVAKDFLRR